MRYISTLFPTGEKPAESELIFTEEGRVYHLDLLGEEVADIVILVGDPGRVKVFKSYMDRVEVEREHREFRVCTGEVSGRRLTVLSTGIGTDNIDIVMNELEIAVNYDRKVGLFRSGESRRKLTVIRAGTCGSLQDEIEAGDLVVSEWACGLDTLPVYYRWEPSREARMLQKVFKEQFPEIPFCYFVRGTERLVRHFRKGEVHSGITVSAVGFYGPQGREGGIPISIRDLPIRLHLFRKDDKKIVNFEMECSAIYLFCDMLGWDCVTVCVALAGRTAGTFVKDYNQAIRKLVEYVLERVLEL